MKLISTTFFTAMIAAETALAATTTLSGTGSFRVDIKDNQPDFTVFGSNSSTSIVLGGIAEVDATGTLSSNIISSLSSAKLAFSGASDVTLGSVAATQVTFSGAVDVGPILSAFKANVEVKAWVFKESGSFTDGDTNATTTAKADTFKWTVKIDGWKFANPTNKLRITADVKAAASGQAGTRSGATHSLSRTRSGRLGVEQSGSVTSKTEGEFKFTYPRTCVADGTQANVDIDVSSSTTHTMTFAKFDNTLVYDPTVESTAESSTTAGSDDSAASKSVSPSAVAMATASAFLLFLF